MMRIKMVKTAEEELTHSIPDAERVYFTALVYYYI